MGFITAPWSARFGGDGNFVTNYFKASKESWIANRLGGFGSLTSAGCVACCHLEPFVSLALVMTDNKITFWITVLYKHDWYFTPLFPLGESKTAAQRASFVSKAVLYANLQKGVKKVFLCCKTRTGNQTKRGKQRKKRSHDEINKTRNQKTLNQKLNLSSKFLLLTD